MDFIGITFLNTKVVRLLQLFITVCIGGCLFSCGILPIDPLRFQVLIDDSYAKEVETSLGRIQIECIRRNNVFFLKYTSQLSDTIRLKTNCLSLQSGGNSIKKEFYLNGFEIKLEQAIAPKDVLEVRFYQPVREGDTITIGQNNSLEYNGKPILVEDINIIIAKPLVLTPYSPEGSIYVQKVLENKNLPFKTLESFEQLGTDKSALLNASEVKFIDSLIRLSPQVPELNNKRIAFVGDKKGFFRDVKRRIASRKPLKQYAVLYVFSDSQKQRSAGFDAAIAFDENYVFPVEWVLKLLVKR